MKAVAILGSPRIKGNSSILSKIVTTTLAGKGVEIRTHQLNQLNYKGCQACGACKKKSEVCVLKDDLAAVLEDFRAADIAILATPVYWGEVTAQMKGFIDRTYSFLTPDFMVAEKKHRLPPGKKLIFIQTQGAPDEGAFNDIFPRYNQFFEQLQMFAESRVIRGCGLNEPDAVMQRQDLLDLARVTALRFAAG